MNCNECGDTGTVLHHCSKGCSLRMFREQTLPQLRAEIERLRAQVAQWDDGQGGNTFQQVVDELNRLRAKSADYEAALGWYANTENWNKETGSISDMQPRGLERKPWKVLDFGDRARAALAKHKGEG